MIPFLLASTLLYERGRELKTRKAQEIVQSKITAIVWFFWFHVFDSKTAKSEKKRKHQKNRGKSIPRRLKQIKMKLNNNEEGMREKQKTHKFFVVDSIECTAVLKF